MADQKVQCPVEKIKESSANIVFSKPLFSDRPSGLSEPHPTAKRLIISCDKVSILKIKPHLPLEVWLAVFNVMSIQDKLHCSNVVVEFGEFYVDLMRNYSKYADNFKDKRVELAAQQWITTRPDHLQSSNIMSFSIFINKNLILDFGKDTQWVTVKFENESDDKYQSYLRIWTHDCLRLEILNLCMPTGIYNIYYKIRGFCKVHSVARFHKITVKHSLTHLKNKVGYIDHWEHLSRTKTRIIPHWQWVPVCKSTNSKELLTIEYCYEKGDELSVEFSGVNPGMGIYNLSFHVITFVLAK